MGTCGHSYEGTSQGTSTADRKLCRAHESARTSFAALGVPRPAAGLRWQWRSDDSPGSIARLRRRHRSPSVTIDSRSPGPWRSRPTSTWTSVKLSRAPPRCRRHTRAFVACWSRATASSSLEDYFGGTDATTDLRRAFGHQERRAACSLAMPSPTGKSLSIRRSAISWARPIRSMLAIARSRSASC